MFGVAMLKASLCGGDDIPCFPIFIDCNVKHLLITTMPIAMLLYQHEIVWICELLGQGDMRLYALNIHTLETTM